MSMAYARIREERKRQAQREKRAERAREATGLGKALSGVIGALDFQEDIEADRGLLAGLRGMKKGEKMSREEYGALRRKVGGTKGGFFGETVEARGKYVESGYVA